ncbi:tetratricopeptide repeat protein [Desulfosporosinus nitroreducens]|uniref:Tetratricopeptide repeat protein n=1 Tax=Desulfosporosinus nitroreducens TaxID=2018668 RepID=A0ABT8QK03_9FIRM|nr:tetratricopeptide repeat protein [Desulfosporosinus nitroreducens]MCO1600367.1 tetratricopeptide repeat protein [Desulfosporosinus nitroreducens]MDO0821455.1 tetratricopeptide repeat protein [Desulfosporosinus nitroreducens]
MDLPMASNTKQKRPTLKNSYLWSFMQARWNRRFGKTDEAIQNWVDLLNRESSRPRFKEVGYLIEVQALQEARGYLEQLESDSDEDISEKNYLLSKCYLGQALIPQAKEKIEQAILKKPQNAKYWDLLADCYLELGDWREAIKALDNSMRAAPQNAETNYRMGMIYSFHEEYHEALRCFQGCCQLRPREFLYWEMKAEMHLLLEQLKDACNSYERALRYGGTPDLAARLAYCYVQNGEIKKGIQYYKYTLKYEPDHYDSLSNLAAVYQNLGRSQEALTLLERAKNIYPKDPILLNNLAFTLVHQGRTRKASEYYREALELTPDHPLILYNLSVCLTRKGNWQEGIDLINQLLKIEPNHSAGWALLGNIYDQIDQSEVAIDCFNKALKLA